MILNKKHIGVYFLLFFSVHSFSQEQDTLKKDSSKVIPLEEVIISATRTIRQLSSVPLPAQIVSQKEIKSINSLRLHDILNEQTGLTVVNFLGKGIQMQGMDSDYTLILIDGVPLVGRTGGTLDLSRVTVGNIKQIEIVKGASSSLYGSEAMAGVVNIITENPKEGFKGNLNLRYATHNTADASASINYKKNKFGFTAFANRFGSSGYDLDEETFGNTVDPYHNYTFNTKINYDFSEKTKLFLSGRYFLENQDYIPTEALKGEGAINEWNAHAKVHRKYSKKWSSYFDLYATRYQTDSYLNKVSDGSLYDKSDYNQLLIRPEIRATYNPSEKHSFIGGLGWTHETLDRTNFSNKPEFNAPYIYTQYDANPTEKLNIIIGARYDLHNKYKSQFSPKIAFRYEFNERIALKSSVGYGYKAPAFRQLYLDYFNSTVGYNVIGYNRVPDIIERLIAGGQEINMRVPLSNFDGELKPESSMNINFGIQLNPISGLKIDFNLFRNNTKDLIDSYLIATRNNNDQEKVFSYRNLNKVYTQGIEINTSWRPTNYLKFSGGYQLLFAKDAAAEKAFENGKIFARHSSGSGVFALEKSDYFGLPNRSRHMANAKVFYTIPEWNVNTNIRATYRSKYGFTDTNGSEGHLDIYDEFVKGYTLLNFAINKTFYKKYELGFGIDNVLGFTDPQNISSLPGQLIYGKINIKF